MIYALRLRRPVRLPVPVVVVGNLRVGGTGKTPLVIELVTQLRARGWSPGVVARGYGARSELPMLVDAQCDPAHCGDEPLLVKTRTGVPVAVGRDRVAAARMLLATHAGCDVLIADDGLQHRRLARDLEIALLDSEGLGNGWLLPAGPLRDPPERLRTVDAVVLHGRVPPVRIYSPFFHMHAAAGDAFCMAHPEQRLTLGDVARQQRDQVLRLLAVCAIGVPERFFAMLREQGLSFDELALPDHDPIDPAFMPLARYDSVLITEKDAVKCRGDSRIAHDERLWVVPLVSRIDGGLYDYVTSRLKDSRHGPAPA